MDAAAGEVTVEAVPGRVRELVDVHLRWAGLAERAVSWRSGRDVGFVTADAVAAAAMVDAVVEDAWQRWG